MTLPQALAEFKRATARAAELGAATSEAGVFMLRVPLGGDIVDRTINPGSQVRPDGPLPLFTISDIRTLWLTASASQQDLSAVQPGQQLAFLTNAVPGRVFSGTVTYVSDALDPQTRTVTLRAVLTNDDRSLRAQTFGEARLIAIDSSHVPTIPTSALTDTAVWLLSADGTVRKRPTQPIAVAQTDADLSRWPRVSRWYAQLDSSGVTPRALCFAPGGRQPGHCFDIREDSVTIEAKTYRRLQLYRSGQRSADQPRVWSKRSPVQSDR